MFLDPDGTMPEGWMYVIVRAATGVTYHQQYGGTATLSADIEGYLVPVHEASALASLRTIFERQLRGSGLASARLDEGRLGELDKAYSQSSRPTARAIWSGPTRTDRQVGRLPRAQGGKYTVTCAQRGRDPAVGLTRPPTQIQVGTGEGL